MTAGPAVCLVLAKAPVPGRVKTRLGAQVGHEAAARLAAAALLDTLDACEAAFGPGDRYLALDGDPTAGVTGVGGEVLADRLARWTVLPQHGAGLAERLARAHADVAALAGRPVVQVGMDTPQATAADLRAVADRLVEGPCAVLGPAVDGGWWVLGLARPELAPVLAGVEMSTARTGAETRAALTAAGAVVVPAATLRDVDEPADAEHVAAAAPESRFARCWAQVAGGRR